MKSIRGLFAAVMAAVCVITLSVSAFAYTVYSPTDYPDTFNEGSYFELDQLVPASLFNKEQASFWKRFTNALTGGGAGTPLIIRPTPNNILANFNTCEFVLVDSDYKLEIGNYNDYVFITPISGVRYWKLICTFNPDGSSRDIVLTNSQQSVPISSSNSVLFYGFDDLTNVPSSAKYVDYQGKKLQIKDDIEPEEPTPSEPDESIPETPSFPPYNPVVPEIPSGGGYVLYDTSVWWTFLERIRICIGSATNIGFLIFGLSVVWALLVRIIKRFSNPGS